MPNEEAINRFKELREARGLSAMDIATLAGVDISLISRWESGKREPTIEQFKWLVKFYKLKSVRELYIKP